MRKKRNNSLNVSHLFALKYSSGPKLFQKAPTSSFSQAVVGFKLGTDGYKNSWPELNSDAKLCHFKERNGTPEQSSSSSSNFLLQNTNLSASSPPFVSRKTNANQHTNCTNTNFPSLGDGLSYRWQSDTKKSPPQFVQPCKSREDDVLVKTSFPFKGIKPKRNDPIKIDIESAIELGLSARQKKEVKRLNQRRLGVLTSSSCAGNALDSANPVRKRGKVRPGKKKKLTALRKTINKLKMLPDSERDLEGALCKQLDGLSLTTEHLEKLAKAKIHTSKFREYCRNFASKELVESVKLLLVKLRGFQDRMHQKDEVKARARRRYAIGFHECWKLLRAGNFKLLILATNIERNEALFQKINEFLAESQRQGVPVIFACTCCDLSYALFKKNRTCIVGIVSYDGANELHSEVMSLYERDRTDYELHLSRIIENEKNSMSGDNVAEELRTNMLEKLRTY